MCRTRGTEAHFWGREEPLLGKERVRERERRWNVVFSTGIWVRAPCLSVLHTVPTRLCSRTGYEVGGGGTFRGKRGTSRTHMSAWYTQKHSSQLKPSHGFLLSEANEAFLRPLIFRPHPAPSLLNWCFLSFKGPVTAKKWLQHFQTISISVSKPSVNSSDMIKARSLLHPLDLLFQVARHTVTKIIPDASPGM